jgi:hypothetical protein
MDERAQARFDDRFDSLVQKIREEPALVNRLDSLESRIVREALHGDDVEEIAKRYDVSRGYVMTLISGVAHATSGQAQQLEQIGLGREGDKNLRGGWGDTGQANINVESPTAGTEQDYHIDEAEDLAHEENS